MRRAPALVLGLTSAALVADALLRRTRLARTAVTPPADPEAAGQGPDEYVFVTAQGVRLDAGTRRAAGAHARAEGLEVLDLVPARLDADRALDLAGRYRPGAYRTARLSLGVGAGHALLATRDVLDRAGVTATEGLDPKEMARLTSTLKRFASVTTDVAVAPSLAAVAETPVARAARMWGVWQDTAPAVQAAQAMAFAGLAALSVRRPLWGAAALAAWAARPHLATAGTPVTPDDLQQAALRPLLAPYRWLQVVRAGNPYRQDLTGLREAYAEQIAAGVDRFLEPRRDTCPWCGSSALRQHLVSRDWQQQKPGTFRLDRCAGCGLVFQNPRLTPEGLGFYYQDYYDGYGADEVDRSWRMAGRHYRDRAAMVRPFTEPKAWLDVGGGHGHFSNAARDVWQGTRFDGLDMSVSIEEAERRRWVDTGHRGQLPELADRLAGTYDVVSMHHYLEHVVDPRAELDAVARMLPAGGFALIEVPDPESPLGRLLGTWWFNWFQPQHLHFVPLKQLTAALAERGLETVAVDRAAAHLPVDMTAALLLMLNQLAPDPERPWHDLSHPKLRRTWRAALYAASLPVMAGAAALDQLIARLVPYTGGSNCYRVLARKQ